MLNYNIWLVLGEGKNKYKKPNLYKIIIVVKLS